jgi:arylformamidase
MGGGWIDISVSIMSGMVTWPEDPPVEISRRLSIERGDDYNISFVSMSAHTGTHMDAPLHFIAAGAGLERMPLDATVGKARVIEIADPVSIKPDELSGNGIEPGERVLFKTSNSDRPWPEQPFMEDYVYLSVEGARWLAGSGVACVGADYLSIAGMGPQAAQTHTLLLEAGIWIIEGLYLAGVSPGDYELACLPLPLRDADGAPARAIIRPLGSPR